MPVATQGAAQGGKTASAVPFLAGSWEYEEWMAQDATITLGASQKTYVHSITPGGFLRGLLLIVSAATGVLGSTATLSTEAPWSIMRSLVLESIDGTSILYSMGGYSYYAVSRYTRPWDMDPALDSTYSASINPAFRLRFFCEGRITIGVLPNTDARAQYRFRYSLNPLIYPATTLTGLVSVTTGVTAPKVTMTIFLETYAQPPQADYAGNPIVQIPDGLTLQRFVSRQNGTKTNTGAFSIKSNRVGNLIRCLIDIFRTSAGVKANLTADPIRLRLDNTQLWARYRASWDYDIDRFGSQQNSRTTAARPTGVYVYFRYHNPGQMDGTYWLPTTEASYLLQTFTGGSASGTLETITEDLAPAGPVPAFLQGL